MDNEKTNQKKRTLDKQKLLTALLTGFAVPFLLLICSSLSIYFSNSEEFIFSIGDFLPAYLLLSVIIFLIISAVLLLTKGWLHNTIFVLCAGGVVCTYIQTLVTTFTFKGLPGDGSATPATPLQMIINLAVWVIVMGVILWLGLFFSKAQSFRKILCFLLVLISLMQTVSFIPSAIQFATNDTDKEDTYYLSTENLLELSAKDNVVLLVLDCFDRDFFNSLIEAHPEIAQNLDGFTYYDDNIATYPRTFPATVSMISGINTDFSLSRKEYFETAYSSSPLLQDLKSNNYKINLYTPSFHGYENADVFSDKVSNLCKSEGSMVTSQTGFIKRMLLLSSYFWLPDFMKSETISANSFNEVVTLDGRVPKYTISNSSDSQLYSELQHKGLYTQDKTNTFTFLHIRGCHSPYAMDENCNIAETGSVTALQQTTGAFKIVSEYLNQMKELGIYENSTIIITGDHADLRADSTDYTMPMMTALLVKQKGEQGTPLRTSTAQVSQENLHASIVKSAQIKSEYDYGKAYDEIDENLDVTRIHYFQLHTGSKRKDQNLTYEITGKGSDFSNWEIISREEIGYTYK